MNRICDRCRFYSDAWGRELEFCNSPETAAAQGQRLLAAAREICDREGDGRFVYFEPRVPAAGEEFANAERGMRNAEMPLVQITREQPRAIAAGGTR